MIIFKYFLKTNSLFKILLILFFLINYTDIIAQNNWRENRFYAYKGGNDVICGSLFYVQKTDGYRWWTETRRNCRKRNWYQEYYSGYIYFWGGNGWYKKWKEGYYWYFTWYDYSIEVR